MYSVESGPAQDYTIIMKSEIQCYSETVQVTEPYPSIPQMFTVLVLC